MFRNRSPARAEVAADVEGEKRAGDAAPFSVIIIYYDNRFALMSPMQYTEMLLTL